MISEKEIILYQKQFILNRLEQMKYCLLNLTQINFNLPPFVSEEYFDFDPETYDQPLWFAYINYRSDIVKLMLEKGYHPDEIETFYQHRTLLHLAASRHDKFMCKLLISYGANIFARNRLQETPIQHAGYTKDMTELAKKELNSQFNYQKIRNFKSYLKFLYFRNKK
jgi:ankyrin repeat protein